MATACSGSSWPLPEADANQVAIKNGWFMHGVDNRWRVHCLGVHPNWVLAIETNYPKALRRALRRGFGEQTCVDVTKMVLAF